MNKKADLLPGNYIMPLYVNLLQGRMLKIPSKRNSKDEILVVYDRHNTLEQWWELDKVLSRYGNVTATDLPGFGGMKSFYRIGRKPTIDNLAEYLAAFTKLKYKRKNVTILGVGYGFAIVTRMLQNYPDIAKRTKMVISIDGYSRKDDFNYSILRRFFYRWGGFLGSFNLTSWLVKSLFISRFFIKWYTFNLSASKPWLDKLNKEEKNYYINGLIEDWQKNDLRTHLLSLRELMKLDNCRVPIDIPLWNIRLRNNELDSNVTEQHLRVIFKDCKQINIRMDAKSLKKLNRYSVSKLLVPRLKAALANN